jgi:hypothetical protein
MKCLSKSVGSRRKRPPRSCDYFALDGLWTEALERHASPDPQASDVESLGRIGEEMHSLLGTLRRDTPRLLSFVGGREEEFDRAFRAALAEFPVASRQAFSELFELDSFADVFKVACSDTAQIAAEAQDEVDDRLTQLRSEGAAASDLSAKFLV